MSPETVQFISRASLPHLGTLEGDVRPLLYTQDPVQGFPKKRFGQFGAELNFPGHFVRSQVAPAMCEEVVRRNRVGGDDDKGLDRFAPVSELDADDRSLNDMSMKHEHLLDLGGVHIKS